MKINFSQQDNPIFLPSRILNKITWFSCLKWYFDLYVSFISSVLYGTNKILRAIDLLFDPKNFPVFIAVLENVSLSNNIDQEKV